jgi:flagellar hook-associated protein 2
MSTTSTTSSTSSSSTANEISTSNTGTISSLGLGSGVLTSDMITKLENADQEAMVTPIENKITTNTQKQAALTQLSTLTSSFQSTIYSLQSGTAYKARTTSGSTDDVSVTANSGVTPQDFTISDISLATKSVMQSGTFSSASNTVASGAGTLNVNINGTNYKVDYDASTTYTELAQKINDAASTDLTASILQTGSDAYSLVLSSKNTGKDQEISVTDLSGNLNSTMKNDVLKSGDFSSSTSKVATGSGTMTVDIGSSSYNIDYTNNTTLSSLADSINNDSSLSSQVSASVVQNENGKYNLVLTAKQPAEGQTISISDQASGGSLDTNLTTGTTSDSGGMTDVQTAQDASFKYNGISLTRSSNTVTDIISGVTINLLQNNSSANATIKVERDDSSIATTLSNFVTSYNSLESQIGTMTVSDTTAGTSALFSGNTSLNNIKNTLTSILSTPDSSGNSLAKYGLTFNRDGTLSFDQSTFTSAMDADPDAMAAFFSGTSTVDSNGNLQTTDGIFTKLYDNVKNLTSSSGTITSLTNQLKTQATNLSDQKASTLKLLDAKYTAMTTSFTKYDAMISTMNTQFQSILNQINASNSSSS